MRLCLVLATAATLLLQSSVANAQVEIEGNWKGACVRDGKPGAHVTIHIHHGSNTIETLRTADHQSVVMPLFGVRIEYQKKTLIFSYTSYYDHRTRTFTGGWNSDFTMLSGKLSQPDGKQAFCEYRYIN